MVRPEVLPSIPTTSDRYRNPSSALDKARRQISTANSPQKDSLRDAPSGSYGMPVIRAQSFLALKTGRSACTPGPRLTVAAVSRGLDLRSLTRWLATVQVQLPQRPNQCQPNTSVAMSLD